MWALFRLPRAPPEQSAQVLLDMRASCVFAVVAVLSAVHAFGHAPVVGAVADVVGTAGGVSHTGTVGRLVGGRFGHGSCHGE